MARPASELTLKLWELFEENPDLTHSDSQTLLKAAGFDVVERPEMSDELKTWREAGKKLNLSEKGDYISCRLEGGEFTYDGDAYRKIASELGWTRRGAHRAQKVLEEIYIRVAFDSECNNFNVTKYNWRKKQQDAKPTVSRKPVTVTVAPPVQRPPKHAPKPAPVTANVDDEFTPTSALQYVRDNGGIATLESRNTGIDGEIAELERKLVALRAEKDRNETALAVIAEYQQAVTAAA